MASGNLSKVQERLNVKFVGGSLCLDFVNTVGGRTCDPGRPRVRGYADCVIRNKISGYDDWLAWSRLAGDIDTRTASTLARLAKRRPAAAARVHARALHLREALYRTFKALIEGRRPRRADIGFWSRELAAARAQQRLCAQARGFAWVLPATSLTLDRILWPVALSAGELLTAGDLPKLKQCGGPRCGWLFLDLSRNHSRHWCDMKDCGNRAKVNRFRARTR